MLPFKGFPEKVFLQKAWPRGGDNTVSFTVGGIDALDNLKESTIDIS